MSTLSIDAAILAAALQISPTQAVLTSALLAKPVVSADELLTITPDVRNAINRLRGRLKRWGVSVTSTYAVGYSLDPRHRKLLLQRYYEVATAFLPEGADYMAELERYEASPAET
jgi:biotin operon repressor